MRRLSFGKDLMAIGEDEGLQAMKSTDRHYFKNLLVTIKGNFPDIVILRNHLRAEIDHRNIINILEGHAFGLTARKSQALISGGR